MRCSQGGLLFGVIHRFIFSLVECSEWLSRYLVVTNDFVSSTVSGSAFPV